MKCRNKKIQWSQKVQSLFTQEDTLISNLVKRYGTKKWAKISQQVNRICCGQEKSGKQCRQRWYNHLDPHITKKQWTLAEQDQLFQLHRKFGNKWTSIAETLNGRSDNSVKNHFYSLIRKSLRRINKFLGEKNGTIKVQKIKSFILTKLFSFGQQHLMNQVKLSQQTKFKQSAYLLINFSRYKLSDQKSKLTIEDAQKIQKVLSQVMKINDELQKQWSAKSNLGNQMRKLNDECESTFKNCQTKISNLRVSTNQKSPKGAKRKKRQNKILSFEDKVEQIAINDCKKSDSQISRFAKEKYNQRKQQLLCVGSQNIENKQIVEDLAQIKNQQDQQDAFKFCVNLDQIQIPDMQLCGTFPWVSQTPNIITPNSRSSNDQWMDYYNSNNQYKNLIQGQIQKQQVKCQVQQKEEFY